MATPREAQGTKKFTREALSKPSKEGLVDIVLFQQEQIDGLTAQVRALQARVEELTRRLGMSSQRPRKRSSSSLARTGIKGNPERRARF